MNNLIYYIIAIYFINIFLAFKILFTSQLNLDNLNYTFILLIIFPFLTPLIYLFISLDERVRKELIKKQKIDEANIPNLNTKSISQHNDLELFCNGDLLFKDMFAEIKNAEHFIHLDFFTFNTDKFGKLMISKLEEKLKENVEVKILYDPLGSYTMKQKYFKNFRKLGGELIPFIKVKKGILNINYRNHRKIMIIDNKISYIGGFNIADKYLSRDKKLGLWVDSHLKITGSATETLEKRFLADYMYAANKKIDINTYLLNHQFTGNKQVEIISSGVDISKINQIENKMLELIYHAEKYIYLQTPYLILNESFIKALIYAANKGVDVRIMLPHKNDHPFVFQATIAYASLLVKENIKIYLFDKKAFLHSKTFICDDHYSSVGTVNLDIRSFKYSLEMNVFINNKDFAQLLKETFHKQLVYCTEYTIKKVQTKKVWTKVSEDMCKLLSTIL